MRKVIFSRTELHKFLLLGDPGNYITDKIHPSIRAVKRKEVLSIFCTLRIRKRTTSVKLGQFPENNLEQIYAKFQIARNLSANGSNPNFYLNEVSDKFDEKINSIENLSINNLIVIFMKQKQYSKKYSYDFTNCLKKNFGDKFNEPLKKLSRKDFKKRIKYLDKKSKHGSLKNFVYKTNILFLFFLKNERFVDQSVLKDILSIIPSIISKYVKNYLKKDLTIVSKLTQKLRKLDDNKLKKVESFIEKL